MLIALKVLEDNYSYFFFTEDSAIAFDVVEPAYILQMLSLDFGDQKFQIIRKENLVKFKQIEKPRKFLGFFTTHHHLDHAGGDNFMKEYAAHFRFEDKNVEKVDLGIWTIEPIRTPCHTRDSICYYVKNDDSDKNYIVTGDTLFYLGCGKFFEGSAEEMEENFEKLRNYDGVCLYGHDYNSTAIRFNEQFYEIPKEIKEKKFLEMKEEKKWNIFLNYSKYRQLKNLETLRNLKNNFQ